VTTAKTYPALLDDSHRKKAKKPRITWRGRAATTKNKKLATEETRKQHGKMQSIEFPYSHALFRVCSVFLPWLKNLCMARRF
jgi:hypothetical protein